MRKKYKFTLKQNVYYFLSDITSFFSIFHFSSKRINGISVMIRVKNEEDWVGKSLKSIERFADEVIIIENNSDDKTIEKIKEIMTDYAIPIKLYQDKTNDICELSNKALSCTSFRWIFRWDADFIAYISGRRNIINLRNYLLSLPNKFYLFYPITISFAGDLLHVKKNNEFHSEGYIHTFHKKLKYIKKGRFEVLKVPLFYKIKRIHEIYFVHIGSAKPQERLLYRSFWLYWLKANKNGKYPKINDYIKEQSKINWDSISLTEITKKEVEEIIKSNLVKYDENEFGEYPLLLKKTINNLPFKIIYKNGKPFSRSDLW
jgi:glycosyltransferase involved in cell wall biosynthesis